MNKGISYILALVSLLVASAVGCSSKPQLPDEPGPFQRYSENGVLHSEILGQDVKFAVLLPQSYREDADRRYPVVYMLHGYGDSYTSWNGKYLQANTRIISLEEAGKISEMIYVFPSGYNDYYCNWYNGKHNYMDMFTRELMPLIDKSFRTIADREHRALTGYSMGGFGAMVLAEKHPELFSCSAPLSMSFRTDAQYMTEPGSGWDGQWGRIFGGVGMYGQDRLTPWYLAHNPYRQFCDENRSELEKVKWFYTCGDDEEQLLVANDSLHVILRDRNFAHEFRVANGAHTSSYWMDALNEVLPWIDHCISGGAAWPECSRASITRKEVTFASDGTAASQSFLAQNQGQGVFFFHYGLSETQVRDAVSAVWTTSTKACFICLPCDLNLKTASEWMEEWSGKYNIGSKAAFCFDEAGNKVSAIHSEFDFMVFVNSPAVGFEADAQQKYYFAQTDESPYYEAMDNLYRSCKRNSATFEYRVIDDSGDEDADRLRCLSKLANYIPYWGM